MMRRQRSRRESAARRSLTARAVATMAALLTQLIPPACGAAISAEPWQFNQGHPTDLLQQHLQHSYELDWRVPADGKCPSWVTDYVAFHRKTRGARDAKYLVHSCSTAKDCHFGLGDRVRGLFPALQLALAHKRVLLIDWASPSPLEHFLVPAQVNWTVTPDLGVRVHGGGAFLRCCNHASFASNVPKDLDNRVWVASTNALPFSPRLDPKMPKAVPAFSRVSWAAHCLLKALFQPSPALIAATNAEQLKLLGSLDRPFVAVHLRMGHLEGEAMDIERGWDHFQGLLAAYQCAWRRNHLLHAPRSHLAINGLDQGAPTTTHRHHHHHHQRSDSLLMRRSTLPGSGATEADDEEQARWRQAEEHATHVVEAALAAVAEQELPAPGVLASATSGKHAAEPMLMLTDHTNVRAAVAQGALAGVVGPSYSAHHISQYKDRENSTAEEHEHIVMTTFVDLMLLARARCLVWARSGFPMLAMTLGFNPCTVDVPSCIKEAKGRSTGGAAAAAGRIER